MIRNLKILVAAAMTLVAVGAFSATAAQAHPANARFHCHAEPCAITLAPDGAVPSATSHLVLVLKNSIGESVSITARQITGYATQTTKTSSTITLTNIAYDTITANGQPAIVDMNGCHYDFAASGTVGIQCAAGKATELTIPSTGCVVTIGTQVGLTGVKYHKNIGVTGKTPAETQVTVEGKIPNINVTLDNAAGGKCLIDETKTPITSEITTSNVLATGYTDPAGTPADQHSNVRSDVWWTTGA